MKKSKKCAKPSKLRRTSKDSKNLPKKRGLNPGVGQKTKRVWPQCQLSRNGSMISICSHLTILASKMHLRDSLYSIYRKISRLTSIVISRKLSHFTWTVQIEVEILAQLKLKAGSKLSSQPRVRRKVWKPLMLSSLLSVRNPIRCPRETLLRFAIISVEILRGQNQILMWCVSPHLKSARVANLNLGARAQSEQPKALLKRIFPTKPTQEISWQPITMQKPRKSQKRQRKTPWFSKAREAKKFVRKSQWERSEKSLLAPSQRAPIPGAEARIVRKRQFLCTIWVLNKPLRNKTNSKKSSKKSISMCSTRKKQKRSLLQRSKSKYV